MRIVATPLVGVHLVELEPHGDRRGFFARVFCAEEFAVAGLTTGFLQANDSYNERAGTLRGLHYQLSPHGETKLVRCIRGAVWDVVLDLRPDSPTFGHSFGARLDAESRRMMYIPRGCAHGFVTLWDDSELIYLVDHPHAPGSERTVRWDDPRFSIVWPRTPSVISDKDRDAPDFSPTHHLPAAAAA